MSKPFVVGVDPSGSYNEGKGTTGIVVLNPEGQLKEHHVIKAQDFDSQLQYWKAVIDYVEFLSSGGNSVIAIEDYVLYAASAKAQINSEMETSKLIGALMVNAYENAVPCYLRNASQVMNRWSNDILVYKKVVMKKGNRFVDAEGNYINRHCMDALRHAMHCYHFEIKKER